MREINKRHLIRIKFETGYGYSYPREHYQNKNLYVGDPAGTTWGALDACYMAA
jgi:hypothetical protein